MRVATRVSIVYMHDNHTMTGLTGTLAEVFQKAEAIAIESPHGMLGDARVLDREGAEIRRVGTAIHAGASGLNPADMLEWRASMLRDADIVRIGGSGKLEAAQVPPCGVCPCEPCACADVARALAAEGPHVPLDTQGNRSIREPDE